jgi:hypothetical protein
MPNTIERAKKYVPLLDEVYKNSAKTGILESGSDMVRAGANVEEIVLPKIDMDGLADYSRSTGYVPGFDSVTWETHKFNYERGRIFTVDNMDNEETQNIAFGKLAGEFIRTKVAPEVDAFRFAQYASTAGIGSKQATITTGTGTITALREATEIMDEAEVPDTERYLFITPTLRGMVDDLDTYKSKSVLARFSQIVSVPQSRFYTAVHLNDGTTSGETGGGYVKQEAVYTLTTDAAIDPNKTYYTKSGDVYTPVAEPDVSDIATYYELTTAAGVDINFMVICKPAIVQYTKHVAPKIITPELNQSADAWKYGYRIYGIAKILENKLAGVYCSHK